MTLVCSLLDFFPGAEVQFSPSGFDRHDKGGNWNDKIILPKNLFPMDVKDGWALENASVSPASNMASICGICSSEWPLATSPPRPPPVAGSSLTWIVEDVIGLFEWREKFDEPKKDIEKFRVLAFYHVVSGKCFLRDMLMQWYPFYDPGSQPPFLRYCKFPFGWQQSTLALK